MKKLDGQQIALKRLLLVCLFAAGGCGVFSPHIQIAAEKGVKPVAVGASGLHWLQSDGLDNNLLFQAEQANDVHGMQSLLNHGADPYQRLVDSQTVLDFAAADGHLALVRLLIHFMPKLSRLEVHADLQQAKDVALDAAVTGGRLKDADRLLTDGANVSNEESCDDSSSGVGSPLMRATSIGSLSLMDRLLARGANVNQQDSDGRTALMFVGGVNMYYSPYNEESDIDVPAARLEAGPARLLICHGAKINIRDNGGKTPLMWAAQGNPEVVSLLLAHGACVDSRDKTGRTALLCAASVQDPASMARLLAAGADINTQDKDGETPLMRASVQPDPPADTEDSARRRKAIALLVRHGADSHLRDKQRRTAADYGTMNDEDFINAS